MSKKWIVRAVAGIVAVAFIVKTVIYFTVSPLELDYMGFKIGDSYEKVQSVLKENLYNANGGGNMLYIRHNFSV